MKRLAYLGPEGTHTEQASINYEDAAHRIPCPSISAVGHAVISGQADEGVAPIENSLEGSVPDTLDLLIQKPELFIKNELVLSIKHFLVVGKETRSANIKMIYSHPQALAQCRNFLADHYPAAKLIASMSTSTAVQEMLSGENNTAAISTDRAAKIYGAKILHQEIEDSSINMTRFVVLAASDHTPTGNDKTSVCFSFDKDSPGVLYDTLGEFAKRGINLAKIESRPTKKNLGNYIFLVDLDGHRKDNEVQEALQGLNTKASRVSVFGSYPRWDMSKGARH